MDQAAQAELSRRPTASAVPPNDEARAAQHKQAIAEALDNAAALMTAALKDGFHTTFQLPEVGTRYITAMLRLERHF